MSEYTVNSNDPDQALVALAAAGDPKAFRLLVLKYQQRVQRLIARLVRDPAWVEDLAQETFIRVYKALPQFRGESQFYTWVYRIAVNTAKKALIDRRRDPIQQEWSSASADEETFPEELEPSTQDTPESEFAAKEIAQAVNHALDALPEDLRQALVLREMEGLSYDDIAEVMGCPIGTVRSRIFRAREAVSTKIKPMLESQSGKRW